MHYVFDFDSTLYETARLWRLWRERLLELGLDPEAIDRANTEITPTGFSLDRHALALGVDEETRRRMIDRFQAYTYTVSPAFLYEDVLPFLSAIDPHPRTILTFGDADYQHFKIRASGLDAHIPDVRIAHPEKRKPLHLHEMLESGSGTIRFVDDNPKELNAIVEAGLPVELYRIKRPNGMFNDPHPHDNEKWKLIDRLHDIEPEGD